MAEIGATLREARLRSRIDLSEIEAQTKIRARYLRALENEEWDVLPGPTFVRTFLRTYAEALQLDPKPLVEQYRADAEHTGEHELQPMVSPPRRPMRPRREGGDAGERPSASRGYMIAVGAVAVVIVALVVALLLRGGKPKEHEASGQTSAAGHTRSGGHRHGKGGAGGKRAVADTGRVTLSLRAQSVVWVCLVDARKKKLIPGVDLQPGETSGPYRGSRFSMILGNDSVKLTVNGRPLTLPESSEAIGYEVSKTGGKAIAAASEPSCG
ncbi:MAG: helix-turn-helix domain-containing protein [Solirubrobacteraceae bacterium]